MGRKESAIRLVLGELHLSQFLHSRLTYIQAAIDAGGGLTREEAFAIGSTNLETLLGVERDPELVELVVTQGGDLLDSHSKVVAVISPQSKGIYLMEH